MKRMNLLAALSAALSFGKPRARELKPEKLEPVIPPKLTNEPKPVAFKSYYGAIPSYSPAEQKRIQKRRERSRIAKASRKINRAKVLARKTARMERRFNRSPEGRDWEEIKLCCSGGGD